MFISNKLKQLKYNINHRYEVKRLERLYKGKNTFICSIHDLDKFIMMCLFIPSKWISKIHQKISFHHTNNFFNWLNIDEMIFDWESARFTKSDKPLNALDTLNKYYPELINIILPRINQLKINDEQSEHGTIFKLTKHMSK